MSTHFATSNSLDMTPLTYQGTPAGSCHEQLKALLQEHQDYLARNGMPDAPSFLAEPMQGENGVIDWYADSHETPVPLSSLPPEEQEKVRARLAACDSALAGLCSSCQNEIGQTAVSMLQQALRHPSDTDIYVCGGRPMLINWGYAPGVENVRPEQVVRYSAPPPPPPAEPPAPETEPEPAPIPAAAPPAPPRRTGCLPWLLPLLLALLLLLLLLSALGIIPSPLPSGCFHQEPSIAQEAAREQALDEERQELERGLEERAGQCVPEEPAEPDPPAEEVVEPEPAAEEPKEPEPEPEPFVWEELVLPEEPVEKAKPAPAPKKPEVKKPEAKKAEPVQEKPRETPKQEKPKKSGEQMQIPKDAARKNDLSFLEGCWRSVTSLYNDDGVPVEAEYCFRANGQGRRFVRESSGQMCSGPATARFRGSRLDISSSEAQCGNGGYYVSQDIQCTGNESSTHCSGQEHRSSRNLLGIIFGGNKWDATFRRK